MSKSEVTLKLMSLRDILKFRKLLNDVETLKYAFGKSELDSLTLTIAKTFKNHFFTQYLRFRSIVYRGKTVGFLNFHILDTGKRRIARFGIVLQPEYRGRGIGSMAVRELLKLLFSTYRVDTVNADTADFNLPAQRMFDKLGFRKIGYDSRQGKIYYELTSQEFFKISGDIERRKGDS